jgi:hypothetical protein
MTAYGWRNLPGHIATRAATAPTMRVRLPPLCLPLLYSRFIAESASTVYSAGYLIHDIRRLTKTAL